MGTSTSFCRQHALCLRQSPGGPPMGPRRRRPGVVRHAPCRALRTQPAPPSSPKPGGFCLLSELRDHLCTSQQQPPNKKQQQPPDKILPRRYRLLGTHHYHCHDDTTPSSASAVGPMLPRGSQLQPWPCELKEAVILEVGVPKFLDTSAIDLNVEPTWIAMEIKGKQFLIHTPLEINPDQCKAERSQLTGSLVLTMPFVGGVIKAAAVHEDRVSKIYAKQERAPSNSLKDEDIGQASTIDLCNIVGQNEAARKDMRLDEKNY